MTRLAAGVLTALLTTVPALAQHGEHGAAASAEQLGKVDFETSCAPGVRADFNRAVALLHSFEFQTANDAFTAVVKRDAECAIAYWGMALCHWGNPFGGVKAGPALQRGHAAAQKGLATGSPTPRERAYIAAAAELFRDASTVPHRDRTLAYVTAMERLQRDFPGDVEARMFYALALSQAALSTDKTYANQLKAGEILEPLFRRYPDHPGLAHYIIHAYDVPALAPKALDAARSYAKIAPSAPHALHMPSHTFTRVGSWNESIATNIASEQAALADGTIGEALHAMDYQVYAYLQTGQDAKALAIVRRAPAVAARLDLNAMGGAASPVNATFAVSAIPARYALERGEWAEAANLVAAPSPAAHVNAITPFARALGAARSGRPAAAKADVAQLDALRDALADSKDAYWSEQVDIQRRVALAWIAFAEGRRDEGTTLLRAAADAEDATEKAAVTPGPLAPARELLGEMLLEAGRAAEALEAFEATMMKEPRRFRGAWGAARAADAVGDRARARRYYETLLEIAADADTDRPALREARAFLRR